MKIRILAPFVEIGHTHFQCGRVTTKIPDELASELIDRKEAEIVPEKEFGTMPRPQTVQVPRPKPTTRPKPEVRQSKSRRR